MNQSTLRRPIVETLLNALEAERYLRGALLATVVDELTAECGLESAVEDARAILEVLESGQLSDADFSVRVAALRQLVRASSACA